MSRANVRTPEQGYVLQCTGAGLSVGLNARLLVPLYKECVLSLAPISERKVAHDESYGSQGGPNSEESEARVARLRARRECASPLPCRSSSPHYPCHDAHLRAKR